MKKNGFTLIELMVTVAVLGIVMSMVVNILSNINKVGVKTSAESKLDNSVTRTLEIIKRTVREARIEFEPANLKPVVSGNSLTVEVFDDPPYNATFVYVPPSSTRSGFIYVNNPGDIIGENITACQFQVGDARRYTTNAAVDNPGVPVSGGLLYYGGNTLVKITLTASVNIPGQGTISRTVSDTVITRIGVGQ